MKKNKVTLVTLGSAIAILCGSIQVAHAHSNFRQQNVPSFDNKNGTVVITTGTAGTIAAAGTPGAGNGSPAHWTSIDVTHGCNGDNGATKDVQALSIVFPVAANATDAGTNIVYSRLAGSTFVSAGTAANITDDIDFGTSGTAPNVVANVSPSITAQTTDNIFPNTIPIIVSNKVVGFQSWIGTPNAGGSPIVETASTTSTNVSTTGAGVFALGKGIKFKPTSCAKYLKILAASVNWCEKGKSSYSKSTRADVWKHANIGYGASAVVTDFDASAEDAAPTLTVTRDLTNNPLPTDCPATGGYDTVVLEPSAAAINTLLPIKKAKYPAGANGVLYWPTK